MVNWSVVSLNFSKLVSNSYLLSLRNKKKGCKNHGSGKNNLLLLSNALGAVLKIGIN
jgi:hypothetical protein